jgi:hypothetical protein
MSYVDRFLETPPSELVADLKTLRDERAAIESKERLVEQLLEMLSQQGSAVAEEIAELGGSVGIGPLRNQISQVLLSQQQSENFFMAPLAIHEELVRRGNRTVSLDNVRVTLRRMVDSAEVERPTDVPLYGLSGTVDIFPGGRDGLIAALQETPTG